MDMRFAAHENLQKAFLNDEIDMDVFRGVNYKNLLGARFYVVEVMNQMQMEIYGI